jgi:ribose-phosphate pyrophosphokinase
MTDIVIAGPGQETHARALVSALGAHAGHLELRQFPDGESHVVVDEEVAGRRVWLVWSLHPPDSSFLPMAMVAACARDLGASHIALVAPYLPYMRQDARWRAGEGISSRYFGAMLSRTVDSLLTVDPHLHRTPSLAPLFDIPARHVSAADEIASWIAQRASKPLIVGPDEESAQWAEAVAARLGAPSVIFHKVRRGDRDVALDALELSALRDHEAFVIDDIISTGRTMLRAVERLAESGLTAPCCVGVHAVFADDVLPLLLAAGAGELISCDSVAHTSNHISVAPALVRGALALRAELDHARA